MKLSYTPLTLSPSSTLNRLHKKEDRHGLIIRGESRSGVGYYEYFPWQQFGDVSTNEFLKQLSHRDSPLRIQVIKSINEISDFLASSHSISFNNHQLITPKTDPKEIYSPVIKIKYLNSLTEIISSIQKLSLRVKKIRVDFNYGINLEQLSTFFTMLEEVETIIDYVEDPVPFKEEIYSLFAAQADRIRIDQSFNRSGNDCGLKRIYKPSIAPFCFSKIQKEDIFSSYMGHPLGKLLCAILLSKYGDPTLYHGIDTPLLYSNEIPLFDTNCEQSTLNLARVEELITELEGRTWQCL